MGVQPNTFGACQCSCDGNSIADCFDSVVSVSRSYSQAEAYSVMTVTASDRCTQHLV